MRKHKIVSGQRRNLPYMQSFLNGALAEWHVSIEVRGLSMRKAVWKLGSEAAYA
jgi:hypothetical protein